MIENIMIIIELIGTAAFAVSGSLVAISCSLDIFGVIFLGCITATGGGIIRDILIGKIPASVFTDYKLFMVALITSLAVFIISYIKSDKFVSFKEKLEKINNIFDAAGLAAFSITGTEIACRAGYADKMFFAVALGMITGIGGGILRDVLSDKTPYVLKKHVYALVSIAGSLIYYYIHPYSQLAATVISMFFVIVVRVCAAKYRWKLPKININ